MCGNLTIQLTCAESLGNQTVNQNVWPHSSYHDSEFKSQTKFHGFMILTGTTKTGIQQIKLSIHTIREILQNFIYCILQL
jgi:hypothetical protein